MADDNIPPGWDYNPATWSQRLPIVALALVGTGIATYLALYQYRVVSQPWDPFFPQGVITILDSRLSYVLPVSDAALGAFAYLLDAVTGVTGGRDRWRTMPWIVIVFAILVGPLGVVSVGLVMAQPVIYDAWCTLCLASAVVSAMMIGPAMDEALAACQYMKRVHDRGQQSWWRVFWGAGAQYDPARLTDAEPAAPKSDEALRWHGIPMHTLGATVPWVVAVLGVWLMVAPAVLGYDNTLASNHDRIVGPLIATFAIVSAWEATRPLRRVNMVLGGWLLVAPWILGHDTDATINLMATGAAVVLLSLVRGRIKHRFGGGWSVLWQPNPYALPKSSDHAG